jgi:hypothetical protein
MGRRVKPLLAFAVVVVLVGATIAYLNTGSPVTTSGPSRTGTSAPPSEADLLKMEIEEAYSELSLPRHHSRVSARGPREGQGVENAHRACRSTLARRFKQNSW